MNSKITVVAIGSAAGGFESLRDFFFNTESNTGLAYIIIQSISAEYKNVLSVILKRYTNLKIELVEGVSAIEKDTIFIAPWDKYLFIKNGILYPDKIIKESLYAPIDIFFCSLAAEMQKDSIGIILSGNGTDGINGVRAIKEAGGIVMVQNRETAKFDAMPINAIATGKVDYIMPPSMMPDKILELLNHPYSKNKIKNYDIEILDPQTRIIYNLNKHFGIDFSYYKSNTIRRRIQRRLSINKFDKIENYYEFFMDSDKEKEQLFHELLIGVTEFFRDIAAFDSLEKNVIPSLFKKSDGKIIRIWSAGCSTGEEAYSLAILLNEFKEKYSLKSEIKIFATDLDRNSIVFAGNGIYNLESLVGMPSEYINKYFIINDENNTARIKDTIRRLIVFATHNLIKDPPFSYLDLITCRNLFIYFKPEIQQKVISTFYYSLNDEKYLFLGKSESLREMHNYFSVVDIANKIFKKNAK